MSPIRIRSLICAALVLGSLTNTTWKADAVAQTVTRLTFHDGADLNPAWDPRGVNISYSRQKMVGSTQYDAYRVLSSGQGGEQALLTGLSQEFGVAVGTNWFGTSGVLMIEEAISGYEYLRFDSALAPFDRVTQNGSDSAVQLLISVNGGGGSSLGRISRDGSTALFRFSTSGGAGTVSIRSGPVSSIAGQVLSTFGTELLSVNSGFEAAFGNGGALNPNGSKYVLAVASASASGPHDLLLRDTTVGATPLNLTNSAATGVYNIDPDFSPDGTKIAFARRASVDSVYDLYVVNIDGTGLTQLTNTPNFSETSPTWSPDGSSIAFEAVHNVGMESEFPALLPGETANYNLYSLVLPATTNVTPKTTLTEPPIVEIVEETGEVTFTLAPFSGAEKKPKAGKARHLSSAKKKGGKPKLSFRYELVVEKVGGTKKDSVKKISKRNRITVKKLGSGDYNAKYRVEVTKKKDGETSSAGKTSYSPSASFSL